MAVLVSIGKMKRFVALRFFLFTVNESFAALFFQSGLELLHTAQEWNMYFTKQYYNQHDASYFQGYVAGVASTARERLNLPVGVQVDQMCAIVFRYLRDNPDRLHRPASGLVIEALLRAFQRK